MKKQTFIDIMAFIRVPERLRDRISNYKFLSRKLIVKIASLAKNDNNMIKLLSLADKISSGLVNSNNIESFVSVDLKNTNDSATPVVYRL